MEKKIIWVGPRESDIRYSNIDFEYSVTYNGSNIGTNFSYTPQIETRINQYISGKWNLSDFLRRKIVPLLTDENIQLMFYNPMQSYLLGDAFVSKTICANRQNVIELVRNKGTMRALAKQCVPVVPFVQFNGNNIPNVHFKENTDGTVIIQKVISSGGYGTRRMTMEKCKMYVAGQSEAESYILSPYLENAIPFNIHMVIFDDKCIVFPPSLQILQESDEHFIYIGADFHCNFSEKIYQTIVDISMILGKRLRDIGYRGICGIDYMLSGDQIYFLEVNARFQASTFLLNKMLLSEGMPSAHELNIMAFSHEKCPLHSFSRFREPKSFFTVMGSQIPQWYSDNQDEIPSVIEEIYKDGFNIQSQTTHNAYLFRAVVNRNLCWINFDGRLQLAPNIRPDTVQWQKKILSQEMLTLKIGLLNQGVRITLAASEAMLKRGAIRQGVFQSVDLHLPNGLVINAPYKTDFSELSPYCIDWNNEFYFLTYYGTFLCKIKFDTADIYKENIATNGTLYRNAAFWATDRLRIHHQFRCKFKMQGIGCKFCNVKLKEGQFSISDVCEIIDFYLANTEFRHFLIGGGSGDENTEAENIITLAKHIRLRSDKSIYAMCLPPENISILSQYKDAGVNEISFNIELFDRHIAADIMPGKGNLPLARYEKAFQEAVRLWGCDGNVRSLMVLGLESLESFFDGIEWLCKLGVMPIISVFRPMNNIYLSEALPPSNEVLEDIYHRLLDITLKYGLIPGPFCVECQNNTLSLPADYSCLFGTSIL